MIKEFKGDYRWLSNFWPVEIAYDGLRYPSVEHAYQASKTIDPLVRERFAYGGFKAGQIKKMGKDLELRYDWNIVKIPVMRDLLHEKFKHPELREKLIATENSELIEGNYWGDTFWGVCDGIGENHLGKLLMEIRSFLCAYSDVRSPNAKS